MTRALTGFLIKGDRGDAAAFVLRSERGDDLRLPTRDSAGFTIDEATNGLFVGADERDETDALTQ